MKYNLFITLIIAVFLSLVTSKIVYYGFTSNFAAGILSKRAFNSRFDHDVYKYRILSKYMLFAVDDWLGRNDFPEKGAEKRIEILTPDGSERFYVAFYYLNSFFLILTAIMVVLLLSLDRRYTFSHAEKLLILFLTVLVIGVSQFVICCYDVSSYFFQLLILYVFLKYADRYFWGTILSIGALIILSTTNRESSALSVSMIGMLLISRYGLKRKSFLAIGWMAICFIFTYAALRYFITDPQDIRIVSRLAGKFLLDINMTGIIFWILFFYLPFEMADSVENKWLIGIFFLFSLPYIYTCLVDGILWEIRLYIPLFLGALFLSKLDASEHVFRWSSLNMRMSRREMQ